MRCIVCRLVVVATMMMGCGADPAAKLRGGAVKAPQWDALDNITSQELLYPIEMSAQMGDWKGVKTAVAKPEFKAAVDAFANAEIPADFATDARKQAKDEAVKHYRALIEAAEENGADNDLKTAYEAARKSMGVVQKPDDGGEEGSEG